VATGGIGYTLTYRSTGEQLSFSPGSFLTSDLTRDGVGNTFSYNSDNTLASIADSTGNTMNFVYTNGVITELDRAATVTDYQQHRRPPRADSGREVVTVGGWPYRKQRSGPRASRPVARPRSQPRLIGKYVFTL